MTGRICASLSSYTGKEDLSDTDLVEIRPDLIGKVPDIPDKELLVTFRNGIDLSILPKDFNGMIDIGEEPRPVTDLRVVSSYHDYEATPSEDRILEKLNSMTGDIRKGAFSVKGFTDLHNIYNVSKRIGKPHVLLGMGEFGAVTRIRKDILNNEFSFGYIGEPTAPGQFSVKEMKELGDGCMITGIIGDPLSKSKSPQMQNAAFRNCGIRGTYLRFETSDLAHAADVIREYNIRGTNVTIPHKHNIIDQLDCLDKAAEKAGAVNTIVNDEGHLKGYNTDIIGIETSLSRAGFDPKGKRAVIMGSGGAARACTYLLTEKGCRVTITGRNDATGRGLAKEFGCEFKSGGSVSVQMHDLIVNCTPVGMYGNGDYPLRLDHLNRDHTVFDMVYGKNTPILSKAISAGAKTATGEDMLAGQGAASFELWTGRNGQFDIMRSVLQ